MVHTIVLSMQLVLILVEVLLVVATLATLEMESPVEVKLYNRVQMRIFLSIFVVVKICI